MLYLIVWSPLALSSLNFYSHPDETYPNVLNNAVI